VDGFSLGSDKATLRRIASILNRLPAVPSAPAPSCPVFGGRSSLIVFSYPGGGQDTVRILREGCTMVSNGRLVRDGIGLPAATHWPEEGLLAGAAR
jgi:hypothetical protein